jgi:hypothetical protein
VILGALLHVVLPVVLAGALVLLLIGRRGRRFLRIVLLEQPGRQRRARGPRRVRMGSYAAVGLAALSGIKAAETAATSTSQGWLVWTMAALAAVLALGGGAGLLVTGRRPSTGEQARDRDPALRG